MESWEHINWFIASYCNLDCGFCFKPDNHYGHEPERLKELAELLVANNVKKVTLGGGEPALAGSLEQVMRILKKGGIKTSLHTNGVLLSPERISSFSGILDEIAFPLDSTDREMQMHLRGKGFMHFFDNIHQMISSVHDTRIKLVYHTVFTKINKEGITEIYNFIERNGFDHWKVYEFNHELTRHQVLKQLRMAEDEALKKHLTKRLLSIDRLRGQGNPAEGCTNTLFADFLLAEEMIRSIYNNPRVKFIGIRDEHKPTYAFLDNKGDIAFYTWFSTNERRPLGNILEDKTFIKEKLGSIHRKIYDEPTLFDDKTEDEWVEATLDSEVWTRLNEGAYCVEEIKKIRHEYYPLFNKLAMLYMERQERIIKSME